MLAQSPENGDSAKNETTTREISGRGLLVGRPTITKYFYQRQLGGELHLLCNWYHTDLALVTSLVIVGLPTNNLKFLNNA